MVRGGTHVWYGFLFLFPHFRTTRNVTKSDNEEWTRVRGREHASIKKSTIHMVLGLILSSFEGGVSVYYRSLLVFTPGEHLM